MSRNRALRDHIATGIIEVAADVLTEREGASMAELAQAAGVSRATLYRYFPNRDALLRALLETAVTDLKGRLTDARIDDVPVDEAIARITRALITAASKYRTLTTLEKSPDEEAEADRLLLLAPLRKLFRRGKLEGVFRADLPLETLVAVYAGMVEGAVRRVIEGEFGVEQASAAITGIYLNGVLEK
ncbi:TetR/AcrR family transcriptional regulator [Flindersiella endophytica]